MNRRPFLKGLLAGWFSLGSFLGFTTRVSAQDEQPERGAPARQQRRALQQPEMRVPQADAPLDPRLEQLLRDWADATATVKTLQGEHVRFVYDTVFEVDKRAVGRFYYEAPDKGRIDIESFKVDESKPSAKLGKDGQPFKVESANPERWICNGKEIQVIDDVQKTVEIVPIPKEAQGANIMDGPLPFLFGMPPDKAKKRYTMRLIGNNPKIPTIEVKPKLAQDAANWSVAYVKLDRDNNYLPSAVKMLDPAGNLETVYVFAELKVNQRQNIFKDALVGGVFAPRLLGYKRNVMQTQIADAPDGRSSKGVPSVIGLGAADAKQLLQRAGYTVTEEAGQPARLAEHEQVVYEQFPKSGATPAKKQVKIIYYDGGKQAAPRRSASRGRASE